MKIFTRRRIAYLVAVVIAISIADPAFAATAGGGLPWEGPLTTIRNSLSGPVAMAISIIGVVVTGGTLIFGGELNEFARRSIMAVMVISMLVLSNNFMQTLFGVSASVL